MGEYIKRDGEEIKIGTCEDLYYCTFQDFSAWVREGRTERLPGNLPPREYITSEAFRFRFPFPNEDEKGRYDSPEHGVLIHLPAPTVEMDHDTVCCSIHPQGGGYNINVFIPCPNGPDFAASGLKHSPGPGGMILEIVQQRPLDGQLWLVVRCPYCHNRVRIEEKGGIELADWLEKDLGYGGRTSRDRDGTVRDEGKWWRDVAKIIRDGYSPDNDYAREWSRKVG